jgi:tRNA (guanine37-N1)-methyltransferase
MTIVCGRYEGVDQRVIDELIDDEVSIGDYVLAGGEVACLEVVEAVTRLSSGVIGNEGSLEEESFRTGLLEYPHYTRPFDFRGRVVPDVLVSGNHQEVSEWRLVMSLALTIERRPDLIELRGGLTPAEMHLMVKYGYCS